MDFGKFITRYKQFGGKRLAWQYVKLGVLPVVVKGFFRCLVKRQSFKTIYPEVLKKVEPTLIQKYGSMVSEFKKFKGSRSRTGELENSKIAHDHSKVIGWCWLQGKEQAPPIVKACYNSLVREFKGLSEGYEIKVIDAENWKEYVELPDYIVKKWEKKLIPPVQHTEITDSTEIS